MARIVQLINKTNQFNLTTRRLNESDVRQLFAGEGNYTQSLRVSDRFGDNGLTGVLIAVREGDALRVHTWLMSCRVMGRRLEEAVLAALGKFARTSGATKIVGEYLPTAKNEVVAKLYSTLGFTATGRAGNF
jgi:FkbH-like protein